MTRKDIDEQFLKGRLRLKTWEMLEHFAFLLPILFFSYLIWNDELPDIRYAGHIPVSSLLALAGIILFIYRQFKVLRFKKYRLAHTSSDFREAANATAIQLNWTIEKLDDFVLIARKRDIMWHESGWRITILRKEDKIFENSIVEPSLTAHPFSFGWNRKNLDHFNENLIKATKGENVIRNSEWEVKKAADKFENEPEWTFKSTSKRIIVYLLIFSLITVCILGLKEEFNPLVIPIFGICIGYLIIDVIIMIKKRRANNA